MAENRMSNALRGIFELEKLPERRLLSAVLDDGSGVDEAAPDSAPADEMVELVDQTADTAVVEDGSDAPIRTTFFPLSFDAVDPTVEDTGDGEAVYSAGEDGGDAAICYMMGGGVDEILGDPAETLPDEVLMYSTGGPVSGAQGDAAVELAQQGSPEQASAPAPVAGISKDLLGSGDLVLGGDEAILG